MGIGNPLHIAFILVLLLLVFGAKRLPEMGRSLGSGLRGFKDSISDGDDHVALTAAQPESAIAVADASVPTPVAEPAADPGVRVA